MDYNQIIEKNKKWIDDIFLKLNEKFSRTAIKSRNIIPYSVKDGVHTDYSHDITWWTNGFWGGLMWLMFRATGNPEYKMTARVSESLLEKAFKEIDGLHHDVGFMFHIVSGASYRLTGDKNSRANNLLAAMTLASRYNIRGEFIRSWNIENSEGWTIIDGMMNLPLLYWASEEIGDDRFKYIAEKHADMTARDHVRADGTVNHIVVHDPTVPNKVLETKGGQGFGVGSCWSRGQSWAVYGFILSYIHTGKSDYLKTAKKVADVFVSETEKTGWLPRLDFRQPETPVKYDSTAGAIAACGLIEIAKKTTGEESEKYLTAAVNILTAMEKWCDWTKENDSVLQMGSEQYSYGVHKNIIYGDFFFTEAILKLKGSDFLIW